MLHGVFAPILRLDTVGRRDSDGHLRGLELRLRPGKTDEPAVEPVEELPDLVGRVAFGVDGDEHHFGVTGDFGDAVEHLGDLSKMDRADVRAIEVAEVQERQPAIGLGDELVRLTRRVGERERWLLHR